MWFQKGSLFDAIKKLKNYRNGFLSMSLLFLIDNHKGTLWHQNGIRVKTSNVSENMCRLSLTFTNFPKSLLSSSSDTSFYNTFYHKTVKLDILLRWTKFHVIFTILFRLQIKKGTLSDFQYLIDWDFSYTVWLKMNWLIL